MRGNSKPSRKSRDEFSGNMSSYERGFARQNFGKNSGNSRRDRTRSRSRERHRSREEERRFSRERYEERGHRDEYKGHRSGNSKEEHEESYLDKMHMDAHNSSRDESLDPSTFHMPFRSLEEERKDEAKNEDRINRLEKLVEVLVSSTVQKKVENDKVRREIPELIPPNTKFTTSMWLNCINDYCLERNMEERSILKFLKNQMTGIVKVWFSTVANYEYTWPDIRMLITKTFPDNVDFAQTLKLLVNREKKPDESINEYYFTKLYLCEACKITGENAVSCIIDGLSNPFMKQDIKAYNFLTPEMLFSQYLTKFPENSPPSRDKREPPRDVEFYEEELPRSPPRGIKYKGKKPILRCETCHKFGHATVACRHAPMCYNCNKKGHIAAKCRIIKLLSPQKNLNTVDCEINNIAIKGLADSGCGVVTIKESVAKKVGLLKNMVKYKEVLTGIGGGIVKVLGEVPSKIKVDKFELEVDLKVVKDDVQDEDLIVGQPVLNHEDAVVVFKKKQVSICMDV